MQNTIFERCMSESILIDKSAPKQLKYEQLLPQIKALVTGQQDEIAVLANIAAALHHALGFFWTGFYLVKDNQLILGPFQGPVACMTIAYGRGVCGSAWKQNETLVVPDVEQFPGHIACSSESKSEIVVVLKNKQGEIKGVLDIDSTALATFDEIDKQYLEQLCDWIGQNIY